MTSSIYTPLPPRTRSPAKASTSRPLTSVQLFHAIEEGNAWKLQYMAKRGYCIDSFVSPSGHNALATALEIQDPRRRLRMFKKLIELGADVGSVDGSFSRDVLMWAAFLNRAKEVSVVLQSEGAINLDLQRRDVDGYTSLHYAVLHNNIRVLEQLCALMKKYAISVDITDQFGFTPYLQAVREGKTECADMLVVVGGADRGIHDAENHASDATWRSVGEKHREKQNKAINQKRAAVYRSMGRLPELRAANFDSYNVKVVHSQKERQRLRGLYRDNTKMRITKRFQLPPLYSSVAENDGNEEEEDEMRQLRSAPIRIEDRTPPQHRPQLTSNSKQELSKLLDIYVDQHMTAALKSAPVARRFDPAEEALSTISLEVDTALLPKRRREKKVSICSVTSNRRRSLLSTSPAPSMGRMSVASTIRTTEDGV
jgi:hypothetical protein